ncbi:hypothetical protein P6709_16195 [Jeotgalibacillus sp. ET6]|uniref:hypothetical protein n=1 Tax=Jeotgalibacillus sp. ET6 TaxID=3037260 RepID=UPI00241871BD|nr:hypothetical protein [Jeotgalibacillus sp. ET6]MDG5473293.1 hypothetical protein [Jeotgalibacillus sp. ET6]
MSNVQVRDCLVNLKKVERQLAEQAVKATAIEEKKFYSEAMIQVSEVIHEMKNQMMQEDIAGQ